jgi:DcuC family C4-dicarboxylate transporter
MAGILPLGFAVLCGSGMAATQSLFSFFAGPALQADMDPLHVGAVVSLAAAAGRTMSPVAAVVLMSAELTQTEPFQLARRVAVPLLASVAAIIVAAMIAVRV